MATIVKVIPAIVQQALREADWAAIDAQTDEDIARNVADDPDAAPILSEAETAAAIARSVLVKTLKGFTHAFSSR